MPFRLPDHHQGDTILVLTSVTKFYFILLIDVAACLQVTIKINLVGNKLNHMYYLIWSSGCLLSLHVVMYVLGSVLSCYCCAVPCMTDSVLPFLSCAIAKRRLYSYVCCSVINFPDR